MVTAKKTLVKKTVAGDKVALYDKLIATRPEIERKGDANPYTAVNGNMFTILLGSERLGIRLPEEERAKFLKKYGTTLLEAYGAVMKEYVAVPDGLLGKTRELARYLDLSYEYAGTLKAKATAKMKR
jgi:TfoX/Sxy family transcriptional regulator of competence genes